MVPLQLLPFSLVVQPPAHATFLPDCMLYERYLPKIVDDNGIARISTLKHIVAVKNVLKEEGAFYVLGDGDDRKNAFFCTTHDEGSLHRIDAAIVFDDDQDVVFDEFKAWHTVRFPGIQLEMV